MSGRRLVSAVLVIAGIILLAAAGLHYFRGFEAQREGRRTWEEARPAQPIPEMVATSLEDALKTATEKVEVLSDDAKAAAARVERKVRTATGKLNLEVGKARREAARMAYDLSRKVNGTVETLISNTLHRFNVPTRRELKDLTAKVDTLGRKIDGLKATRSARGPMKRTRRAA